MERSMPHAREADDALLGRARQASAGSPSQPHALCRLKYCRFERSPAAT
jgi:hypothetical protein